MSVRQPTKIKGFTYIQASEPSNPKVTETWLKPDYTVWEFLGISWQLMYKKGIIQGPGSDYGYVSGGYSGSVYLSNIDRISFPFDSNGSINVGTLNEIQQFSSGFNSSNYGYNTGGCNDTVANSNISRISFPFDSGITKVIGNISTVTRNSFSGVNSSNNGYNIGGSAFLSATYYSTISRINFPFDSGIPNIVGTLGSAKFEGRGCNSSNHGFILGGYSSIYLLTIERITFPFDSGVATDINGLSGSKTGSGGYNSSNYGYCVGGMNPTYTSVINRIAFPWDSGIAVISGNSSYLQYLNGSYNSSSHGYISGGYNGSSYLSMTSKISFPFDSGLSVIISNLATQKHSCCGIDGTDFVTQFVSF